MLFPAILELSSLAAGGGSAGFVIQGVTRLDYSGRSVSTAGDVNGDGIDDVIIGARFADPGGSKSGAAYVVFGRTDAFASTFELSSLATGGGSLGFVMDGVSAGDYTGFSVSEAGDVNGDGIGDLIVGAYGADPHGSKSGIGYVVFGTSNGFPPVFKLSTLSGGDGSDGFVLVGAVSADHAGISVSQAGDVNGDRIDDIIVGARNADPNGSYSGASYVVFGTSDGFPPVIELSGLSVGDGGTGFVIEGASAFDYSGRSVSAAGDVNGDGVGDIIVGARYADPNGSKSGASYVIFGRCDGFAPVIELSALAGGTGSTGFVIEGVSAGDHSGWSVSDAGDVNGDGIGDLVIGAWYADPNGSGSGASYVVFGRSAGFGPVFELSSLTAGNGDGGFVIEGISAGDHSGRTVSAAGDVNGDGIDDLLVGAYSADPNGNRSGASYVVFGRSDGFDPIFELSSLAGGGGVDGFVLHGVSAGDQAGFSLSVAGDVNGDGVGDLIIGARYADANGSNSGASYVVFGMVPSPTVTALTTGDSTPTLFGTATVGKGGTLTVTVGGETYTAGDGHLSRTGKSWSLTIPVADALAEGTYEVTAAVTGPAARVISDLTSDELVITPRPPPVPPGAANHAPVAGDDAYTIDRNTLLTVDAPGLLANDSDADRDRLAVAALVDGPANGTVWWNADGGFSYLPQPGFSGTDSFEYRVGDGKAGTDTATVVVTVLPARIPPLRSITGGFGDETLSGTGAPDTIFGMDGGDTIEGEGGRDRLDGGGGHDLIFGGSDEDMVWGGQGSDMLLGGEGADWILGERGPDTIHGGKAADHVWGGRGDDRLFGDGGPDMLSGDLGNDTLTGGEGADRFVVREDGGIDLVTDYDLQGGDVIELNAGPDGLFGGIAIAGFADIVLRLADGPNGVFLDLGGGHGIVLSGISKSQLSADDFVFA